MTDTRFAEDYIPLADGRFTFFETALRYSNYKLLMQGNAYGKHICKRCGYELHFSSDDIKGDNYHCYVCVWCSQCRVKSENHVFPKYNYSPVELAEGALQDAINELQRRVMEFEGK